MVREGDDDLDEDEERVDMSAINGGAKEREERREKFYSVQQECMLLIFMIQIEDYLPLFPMQDIVDVWSFGAFKEK